MHWNKLFWGVFIALGALIIAGSVIRIIYIDLLLGLLVAGVGAAKLGEEMGRKRIESKQGVMGESINYLTRQVDMANSIAEGLKERNDSRFFRMDARSRDIEGRLEKSYRDMVRKAVELENRMNEQSKLMLEVARRQERIMQMQDKSKERLDKVSVRVSGLSARRAKAPAGFRLPKIAPRKKSLKRRGTKKRGSAKNVSIKIS